MLQLLYLTVITLTYWLSLAIKQTAISGSKQLPFNQVCYINQQFRQSSDQQLSYNKISSVGPSLREITSHMSLVWPHPHLCVAPRNASWDQIQFVLWLLQHGKSYIRETSQCVVQGFQNQCSRSMGQVFPFFISTFLPPFFLSVLFSFFKSI